MKKHIIAAIIGTLILFGWQALSWMALPVHKHTLKYAPRQDEIIQSLSTTITEEGFYGVPGHDPSKEMSMKEMEAASNQMIGKPWALVLYNSSFQGMTGSNLAGGIFMNLIAVVLVIILLVTCKAQEKSFATVFGIVM